MRRQGDPAPVSTRTVPWKARASILSPISDSSAGSAVSEPTTAVSTTRMVPSAKPMKMPLPVRNMPAMATITVMPEISTARPEVPAAISIERCLLRPFARSSRSRMM